MNYRNLLVSVDEMILTVTVNRAAQMNALNRETIIELESIMTESQENEKVRAILITGAGDRSFVSGADIKEFVGMSDEEGRALAMFGQKAFRVIEESVKPVLAAVNGYAL